MGQARGDPQMHRDAKNPVHTKASAVPDCAGPLQSAFLSAMYCLCRALPSTCQHSNPDHDVPRHGFRYFWV